MRKLILAAILATLLPTPGLPYQIEDIQETRWNVIIAIIKIGDSNSQHGLKLLFPLVVDTFIETVSTFISLCFSC